MDSKIKKRLPQFLFEIGMLMRQPRTGYQFLGTGAENVSAHSFRTTVIGYALAKHTGADIAKTVFLCLFHDIHEARTGDLNYVNKKYVQCNAVKATKDAVQDTGLEEINDFYAELKAQESLEAKLAHDADQLDFILNLKEQLDLGNKQAKTWLEISGMRLKTDFAKQLYQDICETAYDDWWFSKNESDLHWWIKGKND